MPCERESMLSLSSLFFFTMKFTKIESSYMQRAIDLAWKGYGKTQPNPLVGAVVVRDGVIVGEGFHKKYGSAHAEVNALKMAGSKAKGADLYVTLDPCRHTGKTGPCTEVVKKYGIKRVISAIDDLHDLGHEGEKILKRAGVVFQRGLLSGAAQESQQFYRKNVRCELPYVILKVATTMDGKIAAASGFSRGITSEESQIYVHAMRSRADAILTGGGTIEMDDPHMGVRLIKGRSPLRVLLDSDLNVSLTSDFFRDDQVVVFTTDRAPSRTVLALRKLGIEVIVQDTLNDIPAILKVLFERGVRILMIEAGPRIMTSFVSQGCVDEYVQIVAPKLLGGVNSPTSLEGADVQDYASIKTLQRLAVSHVGPDVLLSGYLQWY